MVRRLQQTPSPLGRNPQPPPLQLHTSQPLINLLADYGMLQLLPLGLPTLQSSSTKNWTRPDKLLRNGTPPRRDHLMYHSPRTERTQDRPYTNPTRSRHEHPENTRGTTQELERSRLGGIQHNAKQLSRKSPPPLPLASDEEFQLTAELITRSITQAMKKHVPNSKPCPHSKRWWTKDLSKLRKKVMKLHRTAYQMRSLSHHEVHEELKKTKNEYANPYPRNQEATLARLARGHRGQRYLDRQPLRHIDPKRRRKNKNPHLNESKPPTERLPQQARTKRRAK
ncbi:hypothetical protein DFJ58DRAFT_419970 [Suillus subalutaceus]|uniref:uncharacterized protein n=1 Tax=Suillus subalutaceus TaxID=48586 RepID=UPI001B88633B|nr:uncharacterized protein DFJ58DRAFT_419970 [Suillus subalutaceus]KAG1851888.1 hypothetical protein DFJ58DRAFT_419970 [Suillus subalutaceus]